MRTGPAEKWRRATAPLFAALGDETRLSLLERLSDDGPQSITRLSAGARMTRQAVTKHLRTLAGAGLVSSRRAGRETIWFLERPPLTEVQEWLGDLSRQWDAALARLRLYVEG